jgi:TP901 family phage tail tape measure protein
VSSQPVEANVVLTADNTAYDQAMVASAGSTNDLGNAIDSLGQKINNLSKSAGRKLMAITAADVALIAGATTAWASYEKQMSRLQAQSAILARTEAQQTRTMKDYTAAVSTLRKEYGTTTTEASRLVETLSKVTNIRQSRQLGDLSKVFVDMSRATGESSEGLAASVTNLQKIMGSPINERSSRQYADMFTYLSAQTNTSAQGLVDFTAQLAPMGEAMGMTEKQVAGFATTFARSGQEGFAASNVFTKITTDITSALASGSSEIEHYANLVGVTSDQFKKMDAGEQVVRIMEQIHAMGPAAVVELQRLGLEGPKSMKALAAVAREPGGIRQGQRMAAAGFESDASAKAAQAAMKGVTDEFDKLRESMTRTAESMATMFGPVIADFIKGMTSVQNVMADIVAGPFGQFLQMVMSVVAPLAASGGALLIFAGTLLKVAAAYALFRSSAGYGVREGARGNVGMIRDPLTGEYVARGGPESTLGKRGAQLATGQSTWLQRMQYNAGAMVGGTFSGATAMARENWMKGREWGDPYYQRPTTSRGPLSFMAGGLARGIETFLTPQFDQMRHADPTQRQQFLQREAPWMRAADRRALARQMGDVGEQEKQLKDVRKAMIDTAKDPIITNAEKQSRMDALKAQREEVKGRLDTARQLEAGTRTAIDANEAQRQLGRSTRDTTNGFTRLGRSLTGLGAGAVGGVFGGLMGAGEMAAQNRRVAMMGAGTIGIGAMGALGMSSNMMAFGAMGAMMGSPVAAGIGAGVGAGIDMMKANDDIKAMNTSLAEGADEASKTGLGLLQLDEDAAKAAKAMTDRRESYASSKPFPMFTEPQEFFTRGAGKVKNLFEGVFGSSDVEELEADQSKTQKSLNKTEQAARDLADAVGVDLSGTRRNQLQQLEEFMSAEGAQRLADAGVDMETLVKAWEKGGKTYEDLLDKISKPDADLTARLIAGGGVGETIASSAAGKKAIQYQANVGAFYEATQEIFKQAYADGKDYIDIMGESIDAQRTVGEENKREAELAIATYGKAQQYQQMVVQTGTRAEGIRAVTATTLEIMPTTPEMAGMTETQKGIYDAQASTQLQAFAEADQFFKQQLLQQKQYVLTRERAEDAFNLSQQYQLQDYGISRQRAEENFQRMRARAEADFARGQTRALYDFHLSRERATDDYQHSLEILGKQTAMAYDPAQRVTTQRTSSASWLMANAQDQLQRLRDMEKNLDRLRQLGFSDAVIQQLRLTDPEQAQQLARFVTEVEGRPGMVGQFNRVMRQRERAGRAIGTDPSNLEFQESRRGFRLQMSRAAEDFERMMALSRKDFRRGLHQQQQDFNIMMTDQAEDFGRSANRQQKAYKLQMDQMAEDQELMHKELNKDLDDTLVESMESLTPALARKAGVYLNQLDKLKNDSRPAVIALMTDITNILGVEWTPPPPTRGGLTGHPGTGAGGQNRSGTSPPDVVTGGGRAEGGVVPGWSPGRDTQMVPLSGGEAIMRPEWARKVGEKNIDAMNHKARYGGFFLGGVMPLQGGSLTNFHGTNYYGADWAGDLNGPYDLAHPPAAIYAWKSGKVAQIQHLTDSYGNNIRINHPASNQNSMYAHMSSISVNVGDLVSAGQMLGRVGDVGNAFGVHLHFEIDGGGISMGDVGTGATGGRVTGAQLKALLKDRYADPEKAAARMSVVHPLQSGDISAIINKFAMRKIRQLRKQGYGMTGDDEGLVPPAPSGMTGNQALVRQAMKDQGWSQWPSLYQLVMHESGFDNNAQNPSTSAYGMFQFMDATWPSYGIAKTSDPWRQSVAGMRYIKARYGDPRGAWNFWQAQDPHWYGDGSVFNGPQTIGVGEHGPEAVIPLNSRGGNFLADVMGTVMGGRNTVASGRGTTVYNTQVNRNTNFTGAIHVTASNPMELIAKLQARQRVMALSRPSLTGAAA